MLSRGREGFALAVTGAEGLLRQSDGKGGGRKDERQAKGGANGQSADVNGNLQQERGAGKPANKKGTREPWQTQ